MIFPSIVTNSAKVLLFKRKGISRGALGRLRGREGLLGLKALGDFAREG